MPAPEAAEALYFLDHDGRVFVVREGSRVRLPRRAEVAFDLVERHRATILGQRVVFGSPVDKRQRTEWPWKDDLPHMAGADDVARTAGNVSQTRVVAKGAFFRGGDVLLLKDKVGFYRGKWSLPGGYLDHGETPDQCVVRELEEEAGVLGEAVRLVRVDSQVVPSGFHFLTFHYAGRARTEAFKLKEDEVEDARWVPLAQAAREVASEHSRACLQDLLREGPP
jgi:ADP-ribose pyrophosphatase YjhB (NUDIX family)